METLPSAGLDLENDFKISPAKPDIKVSNLEPAFFFLPDNKIFRDKYLPDPQPSFLSKLVPNPKFSSKYFTDLHHLVSDPGLDYPAGTYNFCGARIPLYHTSLNIPSWKEHLSEYYRKDLVDYLEFGFPIGVDPDGQTEPTLKNHSSSYMFYTHMDKFCLKEISKAGISGPYGAVPFSQYQLSPLMTSHKKPSSRRAVFDASFGLSLNKITPPDYYLHYRAEYDFPNLDNLETLILKAGKSALMWKRDLSRYFLLLPLDPVDYCRTGFIWRQNFFFFASYMVWAQTLGLGWTSHHLCRDLETQETWVRIRWRRI